MATSLKAKTSRGWQRGLLDALPLLGGYIPVAISFGLIASLAGFSALEATLFRCLFMPAHPNFYWSQW